MNQGDRGTLNTARITLYAGSTLNILNDGTINMATGEDFYAPMNQGDSPHDSLEIIQYLCREE